MKKTLSILAAVVVVGIAAFIIRKPNGEKPASAQDRTLVVAFENDVVSFDPLRLADVFSLRVASQIFEGLTRLDEKNAVVPGMAESWSPSADFTTWNFRLRDGVKFQSNPALDEASRELTAADVVYSFTRMLSKDAVTAGPLGSIIKGAKEYQDGKAPTVSGLRVVSPREVEFTLSRPDALFPGRISSPAYSILKEAVIKTAGANFGQTVGVGTGAFEFVERRGNDLVLKRYDQYWARNEGPKTLVFRTIKEDAVRLAEAKAGHLDITYATAPMLTGLVERDGETLKIKADSAKALKIAAFPTFNTNFLAFNWPKIDPDLRRAIVLAVDREQIVKAVVPLSGMVAPDPVPYSCAGYVSKVIAKRDLVASKAALDSYRASHPGVQPKLRIVAHELAQSVPISEVLQAQLKEAGIEVEIVQQSFNAVVGLLQKGDFESVVIWFEYMYPKPQLMLETYFTTSAIPIPNVFQYSKPENDAAIIALFTTGDEKASLEQSSVVAKNLVVDDPAVFLFQTQQVVLLKPALDGAEFNGANLPILTHAHWQ